MIELFKLVGIIVIILILLIRKWELWLVLLIASAATGILFLMKPFPFLMVFWGTIYDKLTIKLLIIVFSVLLLGSLMKEGGILGILDRGISSIVKNKFFQLSIPPALIGLLPMPGGALVSAPVVESSSRDIDLTPEQLTYINFWYRHIWEYFWPIYPGLIVASFIIKIPVRTLSLHQWIFSPLAMFSGLLPILSLGIHKKSNRKSKENKIKGLSLIFLGFLPIIIIILLYMVLKVDITISIFSTTIATLIFLSLLKKVKLKKIFKGLNYKSLLVIFTVLLFKNVLNKSGGLEAVGRLGITSIGIIIILYVFPFITGFLTGVNQAYVAVSFPLLLPFIHSGPQYYILNIIEIAYISGFAGVLLSPVHLCLVLSKEYYGAEFPGVYRYLLPPVLIIIFGTIILGISTFL